MSYAVRAKAATTGPRQGWFGTGTRTRQGPWRSRLRALILAPMLLALAACGARPASDVRMGEPLVVNGSGVAANWLAGYHALEAGDYRRAAELLRRAAELAPGHIEVLVRLLQAEIASGRFAQAVADARRLAEAAPGRFEAELLLLLDAFRRGDLAGARARLERLDGPGLGRVVVPFVAAWIEAAAGAPKRALRRLDGPDAARALPEVRAVHTAALLLALGTVEQAARVLETPLARRDRVAPSLVWMAAHVADRRGRREQARALVAAQRAHRPSEPVLEWLAERLAGDAPIPPPFVSPAEAIADVLVRLAEALDLSRARIRALRLARLALFVDPAHDEARYRVAAIAAALDDREGALEVLDRIAPDSPFAFPAALLRARVLVELGREEEGYALLERLAREHPEAITPLVTLGDLLRRREAWDRARRAYERAIARLPRVEPGHWRLFYALGITLERTGRWEEAERAFRRALALAPDQPLVLNYLAYSWVERGERLEEAREMLERAVELAPRDGFIVDSLGWAYYRLGDYARAVSYLERAVELEPGDPVINDHLGDAYWRVGRRREARFQWRRVLGLDPEPELAARVREKLARGLEDDLTLADDSSP